MSYHYLKTLVGPKHFKNTYNELEPTRHTANQQQLAEMAYLRGYYDFEFFCRYFFEHNCNASFSSMHFDFIEAEDDMPERRGRRDVTAAPRGHGKTTFKLRLKILHAIAYGYEDFIVLICHNQSEGCSRVESVLSELRENTRYRMIYGNLAPSRASKREFVTRNKIKIKSLSPLQQTRGITHNEARPSLIILDDVETSNGVINPDQREKLRQWFNKDLISCGRTDGSTNISVIGTCIHPESLLTELLMSPGWEASKYQAIIQFSQAQELWENWQAIYVDLSNPNREEDAEAFLKRHREEMLAETMVLWPEIEPYEKLIKLRTQIGKAAFNSEKQNEPYDPSTQIFNMAQAKYVRVTEETITWLDNSGLEFSRSEFNDIIAFHDPATGDPSGSNNTKDYAAIVVAARHNNGYVVVLDCYLGKGCTSTQMEAAYDLWQKWQFKTLCFEKNGFQAVFEDMYPDYFKKHGITNHFNVRGVTQHGNKLERIGTLEADITNGHIVFNEALNPLFIDQFKYFPTTHDDGPDALQGAITQFYSHQSNRRIIGGISGPTQRSRYNPRGGGRR